MKLGSEGLTPYPNQNGWVLITPNDRLPGSGVYLITLWRTNLNTTFDAPQLMIATGGYGFFFAPNSALLGDSGIRAVYYQQASKPYWKYVPDADLQSYLGIIYKKIG